MTPPIKPEPAPSGSEAPTVPQSTIAPDQWSENYDAAARSADPSHPANIAEQPNGSLGWAKNVWLAAKGFAHVPQDMLSGIVGFFTAPARALFAPETPEQAAEAANNPIPLNRSGLPAPSAAAKLARVHSAVASQNAGEETAGQVMGGALKSMVTVGYDLEAAAINADGVEAKARAIGNLMAFGYMIGSTPSKTESVPPGDTPPSSSPVAAVIPKQEPSGLWTVAHTDAPPSPVVYHGTPVEYSGVPTKGLFGPHVATTLDQAQHFAGETGSVKQYTDNSKNPFPAESDATANSVPRMATAMRDAGVLTPEEYSTLWKQIRDPMVSEEQRGVLIKQALQNKGFDSISYWNIREGQKVALAKVILNPEADLIPYPVPAPEVPAPTPEAAPQALPAETAPAAPQEVPSVPAEPAQPKAPVFETQQEASDYASTVMEGIRVSQNLNPGLTPDIVNRYKAAAAVLLDPTNPESVARLQEGSHFNLPSFTDEPSLRAHIEALSDVIGKELNASERTKGVPVEKTIAEVNDLIGGLSEEQLHSFFTDPKNGFSRSKVKPETLALSANLFFKDLGSQISNMSDVMTVRPNDVTALHITEQLLQRYFDMAAMVGKLNSDWGRVGRILQERDNPLADVKPGSNPKPLPEPKTVSPAGKARAAQAGLQEPHKVSLKDPKVTDIGIEKSQEAVVTPPEPSPLPPSEGASSLTGLERTGDTQLPGDLKSQKSPDGVVASAKDKLPPEDVPTPTAQKVAGMTRTQIISAANQIRMAGGKPSNMSAVLHGVAVAKTMKSQPLGFRVFYNFLLSGPSTWATVVGSGHGLALADAAAFVLGGAMHGDVSTMRLGADRLYGIYSEALDNIKGARAALNAGHSLADPIAHPPSYQVGGVTGAINRAISVPTSIVGAGDEFTRLTGYRAIIRAKSLQEGRTLGLNGNALAAKVRQDLLDSVDPKTGALLVPEALRQAEEATLSGPLGKGTFGQKIQEALHSNPITQTMAPFIKVGIHSFRRVWTSTPLLNRWNAETRAALNGERGVEAQQEVHGRMAIAGALYLLGVQGALAGNVTGRGPTDPALRKIWLKDHQPYSYRVTSDSPWHAFNRMDPLGTYLGLSADASTVISEIGTERQAEAVDYGFAAVASIYQNMNSKLYSRGITDWSEAFSSGNEHAVARAAQNLTASAVVPQMLSSANWDDGQREVHGLFDAIISRIPGYSASLPAQRDWLGEPRMKAPGLLNRAFNPLREQPSTVSPAETEMLNLNKGLPSFPTTLGPGTNLLSSEFADPKTGKTAYEQIMDLVSHPHNNRPSLRDAVEAKIKSPEYQSASSGSAAYPGGVRWKIIAALKNAYEQEALHEFMNRPENKALLASWINERKLRGASLSGDASSLPEDYQLMFR